MDKLNRSVMMVSYILGIVVLIAAAAVKLAEVARMGTGYEASNWGIGACALFLCSLAARQMTEAPPK